jgi:ribosomal protein L37AE/L43A
MNFTRECAGCGKTMIYRYKYSYIKAEANNTMCRPCANQNRSSRLKNSKYTCDYCGQEHTMVSDFPVNTEFGLQCKQCFLSYAERFWKDVTPLTNKLEKYNARL